MLPDQWRFLWLGAEQRVVARMVSLRWSEVSVSLASPVGGGVVILAGVSEVAWQ